MIIEYPITLVTRPTGSGKMECYLKVGRHAVYGPGGVGVVLHPGTSPADVLRRVLSHMVEER